MKKTVKKDKDDDESLLAALDDLEQKEKKEI